MIAVYVVLIYFVGRVTAGVNVAAGATSAAPNFCDGNFSAAAVTNSWLWVFKDEWIWALPHNGSRFADNYPAKWISFFPALQNHVQHLDAVIALPGDERLMLFSGPSVWISGWGEWVATRRNLSELGLPTSVSRIDAAFRWQYNDFMYLFAGDRYWRLVAPTASTLTVLFNYPRLIDRFWIGVPRGFGVVISDRDRRTFFIRGQLSYEFDEQLGRTLRPRPMHVHWAFCGQAAEAGNAKRHSARSSRAPEELTPNTASDAAGLAARLKLVSLALMLFLLLQLVW